MAGGLARSPAELVRETFFGLIVARRLVPILLVTVSLLAAQTHLSHPRGAWALGAAMCTVFIFVAPVSFRILFPDGLQASWSPWRLMVYAGIAVTSVLSIGVVLPEFFGVGVTFMTARASLGICLALFMVGGWGLGRDIGFERSLERERSRAEELAREAERAQLLALRAQLDPHFLFNTLNAIAEWCREDGVIAEQAVLRLSSILRTILDGVKSPAWQLERELDVIETLFALHKMRDPSLFESLVEVTVDARHTLVPPLILLPLAENAIKHGPSAGHRGRVDVRANVQGHHLHVTIENPGIFCGIRPGGTGLKMVERRTALAYRDQGSIRVTTSGGRTCVALVLPVAGPCPGANT